MPESNEQPEGALAEVASADLLAENRRLKESLERIRDFDTPHCRGDVASQMGEELQNVTEQLDSIADLLS